MSTGRSSAVVGITPPEAATASAKTGLLDQALLQRLDSQEFLLNEDIFHSLPVDEILRKSDLPSTTNGNSAAPIDRLFLHHMKQELWKSSSHQQQHLVNIDQEHQSKATILTTDKKHGKCSTEPKNPSSPENIHNKITSRRGRTRTRREYCTNAAMREDHSHNGPLEGNKEMTDANDTTIAAHPSQAARKLLLQTRQQDSHHSASTGESHSHSDSDHEEREESSVPPLKPVSSKTDKEEDIRQPASSKSLAEMEDLSFVDGSTVDSAASYCSRSGKLFNNIKMNKARTVTRMQTTSTSQSNKVSSVMDVSNLSSQQLETISNAVEAHFAPKFDALQASVGRLGNSVVGKKEACILLDAKTNNDEQKSIINEPPVLAPHMMETLTATMESHFAPRFERIETSLRDIQETLATFSQQVASSSSSAAPSLPAPALVTRAQSELSLVPLLEKSNYDASQNRHHIAENVTELEHQKETPNTRKSLPHAPIAPVAIATLEILQHTQHAPLDTSTKTKSVEAAEFAHSIENSDSKDIIDSRIIADDIALDNVTRTLSMGAAEASGDEPAKSDQIEATSIAHSSEEKSSAKPFRPDRIISKANRFLSRHSRFSSGAANRSIFAFARQRSQEQHPRRATQKMTDNRKSKHSVKSDLAPDDEAVEDLAKAHLAPEDEKMKSSAVPVDATQNTIQTCVQLKEPIYSMKNGSFCKGRTSEYIGAKVAKTASDCKISCDMPETDILASVSSPGSPIRPRRLQYRPAREMRLARIRDDYDAKLKFQGETVSCKNVGIRPTNTTVSPSGSYDPNEKDTVSMTPTSPGHTKNDMTEMTPTPTVVSQPSKPERLSNNETASKEDAVTLKGTAENICTKPSHEMEKNRIHYLRSEPKVLGNDSKGNKRLNTLSLPEHEEISFKGALATIGISTVVQSGADTDTEAISGPLVQTEVITVLSSPSDEADEVIRSFYESHPNQSSAEKSTDSDELETSVESPVNNASPSVCLSSIVETVLKSTDLNQTRPKSPMRGKRDEVLVSQDPPFIDALQHQSLSFPRPCNRIDDAMLNYLEFIPTDEESEDESTTTDYESPANSILLATSSDKKDSTSRDKSLVTHRRVEAGTLICPGSEYERVKELLQHSQHNETASTDRPAEIMFHEEEWAITSPSTVSDSVSQAQPSCFPLKKPRKRSKSKEQGQQSCHGIEQHAGSVVWAIPQNDSKKTDHSSPFCTEKLGNFPHNNASFSIIATKIAEAERALKYELARDSEMYNQKKMSYRRRFRRRDEEAHVDAENSDLEDKPKENNKYRSLAPSTPGPTTTILTDNDDRYIELVHVSSAALFDNPISPSPSSFSIEASFSSSEESSSNHWLVKECKALAKNNSRLPFLQRFKDRKREEWQPSNPGVVESDQGGHQILLVPSAKSKTQDEHFLTSYSSTTTSSNPPSSSSSIELDPMGDLLDDGNMEQDAAQILEIVERYYHYHNSYGAGKAEHFTLSLEERLQEPLDQLLVWTMVAFEEIEKDFLTSFHEKAMEGTVGYHDEGDLGTDHIQSMDTTKPTVSTDIYSNLGALKTEANADPSAGIIGENGLDVVGHPPQQLGVFNQDQYDQDQTSQTPSRSFHTNTNSPSSSFEDGSSDTSLFSGDEDDDDSDGGMTAEIFQSILSAIQEEGPSYDADSKRYYDYDY